MNNSFDKCTGFTWRAVFVVPGTVILICNDQICKKGWLDDVKVCITTVVEPADEPGVGIVVILPGVFDNAGVHYHPY